MNFLSKYKCFRSWKCFWKYRLRNGGHFVRGSWVKGVHNFNGFVIWRPLLVPQRWSPPLHWGFWNHYSDVILSAIGSEIISVLIVYWTVCSGIDQRKHHSSAPLAFVRKADELMMSDRHMTFTWQWHKDINPGIGWQMIYPFRLLWKTRDIAGLGSGG